MAGLCIITVNYSAQGTAFALSSWGGGGTSSLAVFMVIKHCGESLEMFSSILEYGGFSLGMRFDISLLCSQNRGINTSSILNCGVCVNDFPFLLSM